ncbi:unnamed protein product [Camellia sinensis]
MASKFLSLGCMRNMAWPRSHYPWMPKYPKAKGVLVSKDDHDDEEEKEEEKKNSEASEEEEVMMALYSVIGMNCSACSASVQKAIKRLPGIKDAVVDVFNNSARVFFYPPFVDTTRKEKLKTQPKR